jgi:hypothetical protein
MKPDPKNLQAEQTQPCSQPPAHTSRHSAQANIHTLANYVQKFAPTVHSSGLQATNYSSGIN